MKNLLLDFDGTLIADNGGLAYDPATVTLLPGVVEGLKRFRNIGVRFFIVTNQSKISRGICTEADVVACIDRVTHLLKEEGITIEGAQWCPHRSEDACDCRKPKTGMWKALQQRFSDLRASETVMVGDSDRDVLLGQAIHCTTARILSPRYPRTVEAEYLVRSINELADILLVPADRLYQFHEVVEFAEGIHAQGHSIVTTNGAFDLFHAGHRYVIDEAHKHGDFLIVGINSDASVRRAKGEGRPIQNEETRARMVARYADAVFIFDDDDPRPWLPKIRPQAHVNAATYGEQCIERPVLDQIGAKLFLVPVKKELGSTTQFLSDTFSTH